MRDGSHEEMATCPLVTASVPWFPRLRDLYLLYEQGVMLRPGGAEDQPEWYLSAMSALGSALDWFRSVKLKETSALQTAAARARAAVRR